MSEPSADPCALSLSSLRLLVSPLRLMSAALWGIVQHRAVEHYGLLEHFIAAVHDNIPGLLTYSERIHIFIGLRAKMLLEMCNSDDLCSRQNLESQLKTMENLIRELADEESQWKMKASFADFSKVIYSLLDCPHEKDIFYQTTSQFDQAFDASLQTLVRKLLLHLESLLPEPSLDQTSLWLGLSSPVLMECEAILNRPEPLNDLLQYHKPNNAVSIEQNTSDINFPSFCGDPDRVESKTTLFQISDSDELQSQSVEVSLPYDDDDDDDGDDDDEEDYNDSHVTYIDQEKQSFRCSICGQKFDDLSLLNTHSISGCSGGHTEANTIIQFNVESNIVSDYVFIGSDTIPQYNMHQDNMVCLLCGQVYTHKTLLEHQKVCIVRNKQGRSALDLSEPSAAQKCERSRRLKTCSRCGCTFISSAALTRHMRAHTEEELEYYKNDSSQQDEGLRERKETLNYVNHTPMPDNLYDMKQCVVVLRRISFGNEVCEDKDSMSSSEQKSSKKNFEKRQRKFSPENGKMPATSNDPHSIWIPPCILNPTASVTGKNPETDSDSQGRVCMCTLCEQSFSQFNLLKRHYKNAHQVKGSYQCPFCKRNFLRLCEMVKHHTDIPLIQCDTCRMCFTKLRLLKNHKVLYNNSCATTHICETCGKACVTAAALNLHRRFHLDESTVCSICGKKYTSKYSLRTHMQKHRGGFQCPLCSKVFNQKIYLTRHVNRHQGLDPYLCEICGKGFPTPCYLESHMVSHSNERPYKCDQCDMTFKRENEQRVHIRIKHLHQKPYVCSECGKAYISYRDFKIHKFKHTGLYPYKCPKCGKTFGRRSYFIQHRKKCV